MHCLRSSVLADSMSMTETSKLTDMYITIDARPLEQTIDHFSDCIATVLAVKRVECEKGRF
jgi:hypothetical protein